MITGRILVRRSRMMMPSSYNSGHMATFRYAQIQPNGWTSHVRKPLGEIVNFYNLKNINLKERCSYETK